VLTASQAGVPPSSRRPVVGLVAYDPAVPSFRLRMTALMPALERGGLEARVLAIGHGKEWRRVVRLASAWRACDALVFQQVKLLAGERAFVRRRCRRWLLDVDDAIMFAHPRRPGQPPSEAMWRQRRFRRMAARCQLVVAGSESLAATIATAGGPLVVLPTPVALASYPPAPLPARRPVRLAWIGLGGNLCYLEDLAPVLSGLRAEGLEFELHVISDQLPNLPGVACRLVPWSVTSEGPALAECDVGLAPLPDDAWTRGKSGYRCIQYAAAGLPTVASPVGANREVVRNGETGLLAGTAEQWRAALQRLCADVELRRRLGAAARLRAQTYDVGVYSERYLEHLRRLLGLPHATANERAAT
jgi:glycosyltransferase involved in cell wall biosynthesis